MSTEAFAFRSQHTLDAMRSLLVSDGALDWRGGDNDFWGEYLLARLPDGSRFRLFVDGDRFVLDISRAPSDDALAAARDLARSNILPHLGATEIEPHSGWE